MVFSSSNDAEQELLAQRHAMFAFRSLKFLPTPYQAEDNQRMSLAYFCLSAMALLPSSAVSSIDPNLTAVEVLLKPEQRRDYVDWVYRLQLPGGGFQGSDSLAGTERIEESIPAPIPLNSKEEAEFARLMAFPDWDDEDFGDEGSSSSSTLAPPNLIQSYTALLNLGLLSDDFKRLNRAGLLRFLARCQQNDGSFLQFPGCPEPGDPRSTYSAFAIASILDDWTAVDMDRALSFLATCQRPEGGFAARASAEPQGGFTYCAIASYALCSRLPSLPNSARHLRWLVDRQVRPPLQEPDSDSEDKDEDEPRDMAGFQGRSGKDADACYSFWVTAALKILRPDLRLLQAPLDQRWLLSCQHKQYGGIAREPGALPDVFHTYLSLAALAISNSTEGALSLDLRPLDAAWNVSSAVASRIRSSIAALPKLDLDRR